MTKKARFNSETTPAMINSIEILLTWFKNTAL